MSNLRVEIGTAVRAIKRSMIQRGIFARMLAGRKITSAVDVGKIRTYPSLRVSTLVVRSTNLGLETKVPRVSKGAGAPEAPVVLHRGLMIAISGTTNPAV